MPGGDETTVGVDGHGREALVGGGVDVELELGRQRGAVGVEAAREGAVAVPVLSVARPGDDEVTSGIECDGRDLLRAEREGVDLEFGSLPSSAGAEALGEHAVSGSILNAAVPGDHEVARGIGRDRWTGLREESEGVHLELGSLRYPGGIEAPPEDVVAGGPALNQVTMKSPSLSTARAA